MTCFNSTPRFQFNDSVIAKLGFFDPFTDLSGITNIQIWGETVLTEFRVNQVYYLDFIVLLERKFHVLTDVKTLASEGS